MNTAEITDKVKAVLEDYGLNETELSPDASFTNDLGLDSLDIAELIMTVENTFDIAISFEDDAIFTLGELVNTITLKKKNSTLRLNIISNEK